MIQINVMSNKAIYIKKIIKNQSIRLYYHLYAKIYMKNKNNDKLF